MGKTADGAVWLNEDRLSAYEYWQYWRNTHDDDVERFLKLFTDLPLEEIARLEVLEGEELNEAKKTLAHEATKLCHGEAAALAAAETAMKTFEEGGHGAGLPSVDVPLGEIEAGILAYELFRRAGLAASNGEARRLIKGGGGRVNDVQIGDEKAIIAPSDIYRDGVI